jgi:hypothetical protein
LQYGDDTAGIDNLFAEISGSGSDALMIYVGSGTVKATNVTAD